jgi:hypothetical protein
VEINSYLLSDALDRIAGLDKSAFVPAGGPTMGGDPAAAAGGAPPMDPAMMMGGGGGAPPMDPSMMMGGGAPPMDPAMMMGGAPPDIGAMLKPMIQEAIQEAMQGAQGGQGGSGGGGGAGAGGKVKVDIPTEVQQIKTDMYQIKMLLAKIADVAGIQLSAAEMFSTPPQQQEHAHEPQPAAAEQDPAAAGGGLGRIAPIKAAAWEHGEVFEPRGSLRTPHSDFRSISDRAKAMLLRERFK